MSALPPSATIVSAARQIDLAPSGNTSSSFSAALIHETGLVRCHRLAPSLFHVVIFDNEMLEGLPWPVSQLFTQAVFTIAAAASPTHTKPAIWVVIYAAA